MKKSYKSFLLVLIQFACIFNLAFTGKIISSNIILLILEIIFILLGIWSIAEMKFRFNIFPEVLKNKLLVTSGPYRIVRHPMYTAIIFITLIWIIIDFSYVRFFIWIVLVVTLNIKLEYEERILCEKFPDYSIYKTSIKKIIPLIY